MFELIEQRDEHQRIDAGGDPDKCAVVGSAKAGEIPGERAEECAAEENLDQSNRAVFLLDRRASPPEYESVAEQMPEPVVQERVRDPLPWLQGAFFEHHPAKEVCVRGFLDEVEDEETDEDADDPCRDRDRRARG